MTITITELTSTTTTTTAITGVSTVLGDQTVTMCTGDETGDYTVTLCGSTACEATGGNTEKQTFTMCGTDKYTSDQEPSATTIMCGLSECPITMCETTICDSTESEGELPSETLTYCGTTECPVHPTVSGWPIMTSNWPPPIIPSATSDASVTNTVDSSSDSSVSKSSSDTGSKSTDMGNSSSNTATSGMSNVSDESSSSSVNASDSESGSQSITSNNNGETCVGINCPSTVAMCRTRICLPREDNWNHLVTMCGQRPCGNGGLHTATVCPGNSVCSEGDVYTMCGTAICPSPPSLAAAASFSWHHHDHHHRPHMSFENSEHYHQVHGDRIFPWTEGTNVDWVNWDTTTTTPAA